jgi:hypothetical protein
MFTEGQVISIVLVVELKVIQSFVEDTADTKFTDNAEKDKIIPIVKINFKQFKFLN